jgi:hypothetical protein
VNYCPSNLLSVSVCDWVGGGGGVLSCVEDHILKEFNTLFLTRFRTYKIAGPPQTKTLENSGRTWQSVFEIRMFIYYFLDALHYIIQNCFICRPSDSTESEDARIEPRTVATSALALKRSKHSARSHPPFS